MTYCKELETVYIYRTCNFVWNMLVTSRIIHIAIVGVSYTIFVKKG